MPNSTWDSGDLIVSSPPPPPKFTPSPFKPFEGALSVAQQVQKQQEEKFGCSYWGNTAKKLGLEKITKGKLRIVDVNYLSTKFAFICDVYQQSTPAQARVIQQIFYPQARNFVNRLAPQNLHRNRMLGTPGFARSLQKKQEQKESREKAKFFQSLSNQPKRKKSLPSSGSSPLNSSRVPFKNHYIYLGWQGGTFPALKKPAGCLEKKASRRRADFNWRKLRKNSKRSRISTKKKKCPAKAKTAGVFQNEEIESFSSEDGLLLS